MMYLDYEWDLHPDRIVLDKELNVKQLGWTPGDYFKLIEVNGKMQLIKVDPLEKFLNDGLEQNNGCS